MDEFFACVKSGVVVNTVVCSTGFAAMVQQANAYDAMIDVTALPSRPGPGWLYDGTNFSAPTPPTESPTILFAFVKSGIVVGVLKTTASDAAFIQQQNGFDAVVDVTTVSPQPESGWTYNGSTFAST